MAKEISGIAVTAAAVGAFFVYAGIKDVSILSGLRQIMSGQLPAGTAHSPSALFTAGATVGGVASVAGQYAGGGISSGPFPELANEALKYVGLPYSQAPSLRLGESAFDCSGLVWRCFHNLGISAPTVTFTQQPWSSLTTIDASQVGAGDLVFWPGHVIIAISNTEGIGAENPRRGVVKGPISQLGVPGTPATYKRYTGPRTGSVNPKTHQYTSSTGFTY
ncbi:MAG TPA: NlpC/P60 family protein [Ktedonobacteraceae bacterium]|nr:NlpC/P60 family protein [Ktedonobacteraceae bacterium]